MSKQENETSDKSVSSVSSTEHSVGPISNLNAFSNTVVEDKISNDLNKCVSGDNITTTTITTTNNNVPLSRPTDHLIAIQPSKLSTHCTTDVWNPISTSQNCSINNNSNNNTNNIVVQRKIRPPPKKRLSTNYTRSNSSRSFTDNTNSTPSELKFNRFFKYFICFADFSNKIYLFLVIVYPVVNIQD